MVLYLLAYSPLLDGMHIDSQRYLFEDFDRLSSLKAGLDLVAIQI